MGSGSQNSDQDFLRESLWDTEEVGSSYSSGRINVLISSNYQLACLESPEKGVSAEEMPRLWDNVYGTLPC